MNIQRTTYGVNFNTGISNAEYNEQPVGQTQGQTQQSILPGSTTVSEALAGVFPKDPTIQGLILSQLAASGSAMPLRTGRGFREAATRTVSTLRAKKGEKAARAADEIEALLEDTELLDRYRAALLES